MTKNSDGAEIIYIGGNTAADLKERVKSIAGLSKVEKQLKARAKEVGTQIREAIKKAQSAGHDPGIIKKVVKEALLTSAERAELYDNEDHTDAVVEATRKALGLIDSEKDDVLGIAAVADEAAKGYAGLLKGNDLIDDEPVMDRAKGGRS